MKVSITAFSVGLLLGLSLSFFYFAFLVSEHVSPPRQSPIVSIEKGVAKKEAYYSKAFDSLATKNSRLTVELQRAKNTLAKTKQHSKLLEIEVQELITNQREGSIEESTEGYSDCDSLIATVEYMMENATLKDSLQEAVASNLESQLTLKDSAIAINEQRYTELKSAFHSSVQLQNELSKENKLLSKSLKKQKVKSKLLSGVLFILGSAATGYLINH